ncbi:MAG: hypothetical protein ABI690_24565 [Chloroflexota bacterium]
MRRRTCLITVIVFIILAAIFAVWLFRTEHVVLIAKPGETVSAYGIPAISAHRGSLGGNKATIYHNSREVEHSGYLCKGGIILERLNDSETNNDVTVENGCSESLTIEIWWYSFRLLNPLIPLIAND